MNLRVTIPTNQQAFGEFDFDPLERPVSHPAPVGILLAGVFVMKIKRRHAPIVSADFAAATFVRDGFLFVPLKTCDLESIAALSAVGIPSGGELARIRLPAPRASSHSPCSEFVFGEPITDRRLGDA
jgi:hypothetical protein